MAISDYQGGSNKLQIWIRDSGGAMVDPSSATFLNVDVFVVHRVTNDIIAKFTTLSPLPVDDKLPWKAMTTEDIGEDAGVQGVCILDTADSLNAKTGNYEVQVDAYVYDPEFDDNKRLLRSKGILIAINPAVNG